MKLSAKLRQAGVKFVQGPLLGICEFSLPNGLTVMVRPDATINSAVVMAAYNVGSRDEAIGEEGMAHFCEHMFFKGSKKFNPKIGNDHSTVQYFVGAQPNAYTSASQTVYHSEVPSEHVQLVIAMMADRMRSPLIQECDRAPEAQVVLQEMSMYEDQPFSVLLKAIASATWAGHPYQHSVLGSPSVVANSTARGLKEFYGKFYHPNNMVLLVGGNVTCEEVLAYAVKHYGGIARWRRSIPRIVAGRANQLGEQRFEIISAAAKLPHLAVSYRAPPEGHSDWLALELLTDILGNKEVRTSRLYASLAESGMVASAGCFLSEVSGCLFYAIPNGDVTLAQVEAIFDKEVKRLISEFVSDSELEQVKAAQTLQHGFANAETIGTIRGVCRDATSHGLIHYAERLNKYLAVTKEDILRVAGQYLRPTAKTVGVLTPRTAEQFPPESAVATDTAVKAAVKAGKLPASAASSSQRDPLIVEKTVAKYVGAPRKTAQIAPAIVQKVLPNGLTVNLLPRSIGTGKVAVNITVRGAGNFFEGKVQNLADIAAELITCGSSKFSKMDLALELNALGMSGGLSIDADSFNANVKATVKADHLGRCLDVLADILRHPLFAKEELDQVTRQWASHYQLSAGKTGSVAANLASGLIYPAGHAFRQKTFAEQLADLGKITVEGLADFHRQTYTPKGTIISIVGDVADSSAALDLVTGLFGDWLGGEVPAIVVPAGMRDHAGHTVMHTMAGQAQSSIVMAAPTPLHRSAPDFLAARLGLKVLGADALTGRLGQKVREELGLTYGISAYCGDSSYGWAPWTVGMGVKPENVTKAIEATKAVLADFVRSGVTVSELAREANNEAGASLLLLDHSGYLAALISGLVALALPLELIDSLPARALATTVDEVNAAVRRYFDPNELVTVIAGSGIDDSVLEG